MKKYILAFTFLAFATASFAQSSWRWGLTIGSADNGSKFTGGMTNASALFQHSPYESGQWGVLFRKTLSDHFSFQTGFKGVSFGFQYGMAQDYSLLKPFGHYNWNRVRIGSVQIPASIIWNSKPNCSNVRWYVGMGVALAMTQKVNVDNNSNTSSEALGNTSTNSYIDQTVQANGGFSLNGHFLFGIERTFNSGRMLNLGIWWNRGFSVIGTSNVTYTAENQTYNHTFTNFSNYAGITVSYYFKPIGSRRAEKAAILSQLSGVAK
jgi:hypothetical protein